MCLMEKVSVLGQPHSGTSYDATDHELRVSEPAIYIPYGIFKQQHIRQSYGLADGNVTCGLKELHLVFLPGEMFPYSLILYTATS